MNNIYPSNELLKMRFGIDHNNCAFCETEIETTDHLFFHCIYSGTLWEDLQDWLSTKIQLTPLKRENVVFGVNLKPDYPGKILHPHIQMEKNKTIFLCFQKESFRHSPKCFKTDGHETCTVSPCSI